MYDYLSARGDIINVIAVVDISERKWGSIWNGFLIENPDILLSCDFDKLITAIENWMPVYKYAMGRYKIQKEKLDNYNFIQREMLLEFYGNKENSKEKEIYLDHIKKFPLDVFNDVFTEKYSEMEVEIYLDESVQMYYVYYCGKKMYFPRNFSKENVKAYYPCVLMEQDKKSPHKISRY